MRTIAVALAALALAALLLSTLVPVAGAAPTAQQGNQSACKGVDAAGRSLQSRVISPTTILLCETARVSVTVGAACDAVPLHIVINVDRSGSMIGQPMEDVKNAARSLVRALDMRANPKVRVGLVSHGDPAQINSFLTDREGQILGQIGNLAAGGEDNLPDSISKSYSVLTRDRRQYTERPVEVIVVLSDGGQTYPPAQGVQAAGRPKSDGVLMVGVCSDNGTPGGCQAMQRIASSGKYYFQARGTAGMTKIFTDIANEVSNILLRSMTIEETLPDDLDLVPGSALPPADVITTGLRTTLRWSTSFPGRSVTVAYTVRPRSVTTYTLATSKVEFRDSQDKLGSLIVPTAVLTVSGPCLDPPTATPPPTASATPSPTNTPSATPTATATVTPSATPTPRPQPGRVFLPILNLYWCRESDRPADVVLLVDASTSMNAPTQAGRPKIEAARDGARAFVDLARPVDRVALFAFHERVDRLAPLTADRAVLHAAVDAIATAPWTRIDLALAAALDELTGPRAGPGHLPVIVLMTDGHPTRTTPEAVLDQARRARAAGILVFAIGVGSDLDAQLLHAVAGDASRYHGADDAEALRDIYQRIATTIPCAPRP